MTSNANDRTWINQNDVQSPQAGERDAKDETGHGVKDEAKERRPGPRARQHDQARGLEHDERQRGEKPDDQDELKTFLVRQM